MAARPLRRAHEMYAPKWLSLCHEDDEAVQGLKYLPSVKLHFFEKDFAVSTLTMAAVSFSPLAYLLVVTSPTIMVGIADFLKNKVYAVDQYQGAESADNGGPPGYAPPCARDARRTRGGREVRPPAEPGRGLTPQGGRAAHGAQGEAPEARNVLSRVCAGRARAPLQAALPWRRTASRARAARCAAAGTTTR